MSILDALARLWKRTATHYIAEPIPPDHVHPPIQTFELKAEDHYFRVWAAEMFLKEDGRLFRSYVPVIHSSVSLQFGNRAAQDLPYVAGPHTLGLTTTLGKGVQLDHALTNLLPFRGGQVGVAAALVAYKEKDYLASFVDTLSGIAGLLNVGQLSAVLKVVDSAVDGIQDLLAGADKDVHLLYYKGYGGDSTWGGASLTSGYTAVIKASSSQVDRTKLWVKDRCLYYGPTLDTARPLEGYDYFLLRIEGTSRRDDFLSFESFASLLLQAIKEGHRDRAAGDAIINTIMVAVWESADLTRTDRYVVAKAIETEYKRAMGQHEPELSPPLSPIPAGPLTPLDKAIASIANTASSLHISSRVANELEKEVPFSLRKFQRLLEL